mgnify:CR=1 FL=1
MNIEEIENILESIESEATDVYDAADVGCEETADSDPTICQVEDIITTAYGRFDDIRDWVGTITNLVEDVKAQLEGVDPKVCSKCGDRG